MSDQLKAQILHFLKGTTVATIQPHHFRLQIRNLTLATL